jgi:peroxiredoxin
MIPSNPINAKKRVELNQPAPDFTLRDFNGNEVSLSDFQGRLNVLLVFNRGFF